MKPETVALETSDLHQALAYAVRLTLENDSPDTQKAWLTRFNIWALYPALYPDIKHYLQRYKGLENTPLPDEHELLEQLLKAGLIATPRAVAVREYRWGREFSHLNMALEIDPDLIWKSGEQRPALCHLTHAMGPYLRQAADLMGLPPSPADQPALRLGTLHSIPPEQADRSPTFVNPRVVLAIYWQAKDLAPEEETRRISR
ncbi:hypothetical protein [Azotobacter vinelandii]|uniref:hypothetical protein n=1 Tax=Azotobacter vinelandii TaxID=354 RepID=UPI00091A2874|nr:hypothetical protein [Azotobacter vinelandii]WKN23213.1 hypothetical protein AVAEIV_001250 [Azotobacter vinelandii]SFY07833.1 hypothetical protein SAMN04244547_03883 [Azotobacter vinelandii]